MKKLVERKIMELAKFDNRKSIPLTWWDFNENNRMKDISIECYTHDIKVYEAILRNDKFKNILIKNFDVDINEAIENAKVSIINLSKT